MNLLYCNNQTCAHAESIFAAEVGLLLPLPVTKEKGEDRGGRQSSEPKRLLSPFSSIQWRGGDVFGCDCAALCFLVATLVLTASFSAATQGNAAEAAPPAKDGRQKISEG